MLKRVMKDLVVRSGYKVFKEGSAPNQLRTHFTELVAKYAIDCVIDVGANAGQYGELLRGWGFDGHIVSFEPIPAAFAKLNQAASNDPKWHCYNVALGETREQKAMHVVPDLDVLSSFHQLNDFATDRWASADRSVEHIVQIERLDELIGEISEITGFSNIYLKLDTQGFDLLAFNGAAGCLARIRAMQSELAFKHIYDNMPDVLSVLETYRDEGFELCGVHPVSRQDNYAFIEADGVFVNTIEQ